MQGSALMPKTDLVATCSPFRHTSANSKAKVTKRKQDALRGVESPLIFMAHEQTPTQVLLVSTPDDAKLSTIALPVHGVTVAVFSTEPAHRWACPCPATTPSLLAKPRSLRSPRNTPSAKQQLLRLAKPFKA